MKNDRLIQRIWDHDYTLWKPEPREISNRLDWLSAPAAMAAALPELNGFTADILQEDFSQVVLLGMGGSSLAPEMFSRVFDRPAGYLPLKVLDSTHPAAVMECAAASPPDQTLYIVSTKSGGTEETLSFFRYFYNLLTENAGVAKAGAHFIAITDPGSSLEGLAAEFQFRKVFLNNPNLGGRFSAFSYFGLVPAALCGVDLPLLVEDAQALARQCEPDVSPRRNPAAQLAAFMVSNLYAGRDKLTFILPERLASFGDWVEQLIAESLGKEGKSILPVVHEILGAPNEYRHDRQFVHLDLLGHTSPAETTAMQALKQSGYPLLRLELRDRFDIGGQIYLWELAVAIIGHFMGINPFDQPNVESAKVRARQMVMAYKETGALSSSPPLLEKDGVAVFTPEEGGFAKTNAAAVAAGTLQTADQILRLFLDQAQDGDYIALQAFLQPSQANRQALEALRLQLRRQTGLAVVLGFGPRFLHSTGQLHKGDRGNGLFIQITDEPGIDAPIPERAGERASALGFKVLLHAQVLGDGKALADAGRRMLRLHFYTDPAEGLIRLANTLT